MRSFAVIVLTLGSFTHAQDQNTPPQFVGTWVGTRKQIFGQVDPSVNPDALECVTDAIASPSQTITMGTKNVAFSAYGATITNGLGMAAYPGLSGTWAQCVSPPPCARDRDPRARARHLFNPFAPSL